MRYVWAVEYSVPYETAGVIAVYDSEEKADKRAKKILRQSERYQDKVDKHNEAGDEAWWEESPEHYGDDIDVFKYRVR